MFCLNPNKIYTLYSHRAFKFLNWLSTYDKSGFHTNIRFSHFLGKKIEIFATWQPHPPDSSSKEQPALTQDEDPSSLATPTPQPPAPLQALAFAMLILHFLVSFSHLTSLSREVTGAILWPTFPSTQSQTSPLPLFFLHQRKPLESTRFLLELGVGQRGGVLPRMIGQFLEWLPPGHSDNSSAPWNAPNQLSFRLMVTKNRAHCPLLQVEKRSASNSLCDLEEITLPFWASVAPSTQWNYVEWRKVG